MSAHRFALNASAAPGVLWEHRAADYVVHVARYGGGQFMPPHAHDVPGMSVVLAGALTEEACGREVIAESGSVVVKPAGIVHANRVSPGGALMLSVSVLRASLFDHVEACAPAGWRWARDPLLAEALLRMLVLAGPDIASEGPDDVDGLIGDVSARALRPRVSREHASPEWLRHVRATLDAAPPGECSVRQLAACVDVSPVHLARRFRARYGLSIRDYQRCAKARRAVALIMSTPLPLAEIALGCGYTDQSHMARAVRATTGTTASRLRRMGSRPVHRPAA